MSVECRFCYEPFKSVQAVRAHLRSCPQRRDGYQVRYRGGVGTVVAAPPRLRCPDAERCPGAPSPATFAASMRKWWALAST